MKQSKVSTQQEYSNQGNRITIPEGNEIAILEFKNEFNRLLSVGALQQQQSYARATSHVRPKLTLANLTRLTAAGIRYQTADISNNFFHLPFVERQCIGRANYYRNFYHTHGQQGSHNTHQCRDESARHQPQ